MKPVLLLFLCLGFLHKNNYGMHANDFLKQAPLIRFLYALTHAEYDTLFKHAINNSDLRESYISEKERLSQSRSKATQSKKNAQLLYKMSQINSVAFGCASVCLLKHGIEQKKICAICLGIVCTCLACINMKSNRIEHSFITTAEYFLKKNKIATEKLEEAYAKIKKKASDD